MEFKSIETERLNIRKFSEYDAPVFFRYRTDENVYRYQGDGWADFSLEQARNFVAEQSLFEPGIPGTWFQAAIELREDKELIGDLGIHTFGREHAEIGITIKPSHQKKGYALEALLGLFDFLFGELKIYELKACVDTKNIDSINLLMKAGMKKTGLNKNIMINNVSTDEYMFCIFKDDWKKYIVPTI
jgi:RimJ/RimL family protein N-acetyltransferase